MDQALAAPTSADGESASPDQAAQLDALAAVLATERGEAIQGRQASGIEDQWREDEEFYAGIDDANRDESRSTWGTKPPGQAMPPTIATTRSKVFPNITRPYVDAAAARIADMLLPTDDRPWAIEPTPIPDLIEVAEGRIPPALQQQLAAIGGDPQALQKQAAFMMAEAKKQAQAASDQIEDWQVEGQYHAEVRNIIEDAARIGVGVLKGPIPVKRRVIALQQVGQQGQDKPSLMDRLMGGIKKLFAAAQAAVTQLVVKQEIKPASKRVNPWYCFPDPACGENIHNGSYHWEVDYLTRKQLEDCKGGDYIDAQIDLCLQEGPQKAQAPQTEETKKKNGEFDDKRFEIWYRYGNLTADQMSASGCECEAGPDGKIPDSVPAMLTMVNARVIKATLNPLDSGEFPYDYMPWQRRSGSPWGDGVARQGRTPQRIVTSAVRNWMDNAGLSAGVQIVLGTSITGADGNDDIRPRKVWRFTEDADNDDVRKAMNFFEIPSRQKELQELVLFGMKLMEDSTGLPMLLQGQQGGAPDTVGGMNLLNNNASAVLRRLARTFDDKVTEPHVRRYYTWLLQHGENDSMKGDFTIDARGSTALVERDLQNQHIPELVKVSPNPIYGIDPKKAMSQFLKSLHFDPKAWEYDDEEWKKVVASLQQKPQAPVLAVAQLKEQGQTERLKMEQQFDAEQNDADRRVDLLMGRIDEQIEAMKDAGAKAISFDELKVKLADTAMKLKTQRDLSAQDKAVDLHKHATDTAVGVQQHRTDTAVGMQKDRTAKAIDLHKHAVPQAENPPTEPAGKASTGRAFQA